MKAGIFNYVIGKVMRGPSSSHTAAEYLNTGDEELIKAYLAAGLTGVFIADRYTFAAEGGGCQVECGFFDRKYQPAISLYLELQTDNSNQADDSGIYSPYKQGFRLY